MRTLLYIEDHLDNVLLMESILEEFEDIRLVCVYSAEQGIDQIRRDPPDLVLMDINLPGIDGYTALKLIKESSSTWDIPVIAITGNAKPDDEVFGKVAGFDAYVTKPIQIDSMTQTIQDTLVAYS